MQNQQGLNISEKDKNEQNEMKLAGQVEVNPQFEHNEEQRFSGFDFGLSQGDWVSKEVDNNVNEFMSENVSEIEQIKKDEFEYDFTQIDNNNTIDNNNNANSSTLTNDQFQTFQQQTTNQPDQSNQQSSFFVNQNQQNKQSQQMKEKRLKLQSLYKVSKSRSLLNKKNKQQSQLQQLVKYNQENNNVSIYTNANRNTKTKLYSSNTKNKMNNNNNNNKMQQQQQSDFFSFTQSQQLKQQQQNEEENEFAVFDRPSLFGNKQYHSTSVQQYHSTYVQSQKDEVNSPSNLLYNNHHDNDEMSNNFQTQILLSPQSGIMQSTQGQYNSKQIKDNKVFSTKFLPTDLLATRLIISAISITSIALLYGFMNCIFLFVIHDFLLAALVIKQIVRTNTIRNRTNTMKNINNYRHNNNTKRVNMNQQLSLNDQLEIPSSQRQRQQFRMNISDKFDQYKSQLESSLKWHKYLQYTLYISSISMFIFILVQITQLDTFFTANYFSLTNWAHIIIISIIYTLQLWSNCKLNKKVNQVTFYQDNYLKSYQSQL